MMNTLMHRVFLLSLLLCGYLHTYAQGIPEKKKGHIQFRDKRVLNGWIQYQHWSKFDTPPSIVFYKDSSQQTGTTYTPKELDFFDLSGIGRYTSMGVLENCSYIDSIFGQTGRDSSY